MVKPVYSSESEGLPARGNGSPPSPRPKEGLLGPTDTQWEVVGRHQLDVARHDVKSELQEVPNHNGAGFGRSRDLGRVCGKRLAMVRRVASAGRFS